MEFTVDAGDIIAGLALLFSVYATVTTARFNRRQKSLIESQERLNNLLLDKEKAGSAGEKMADLGASFVNFGSGKHRLKIWNRGRCIAGNVTLEFPEGNAVLIPSDIDQKFPLETLETQQSGELLAVVTMGTKSKHAIKLIWSDDHSERNEKVVYPTL